MLPLSHPLSTTSCLQVRNLTSVRCVEKPLVRAPTSSPTVGSTQASSPLAVICVAKASKERWIYGDTGRHSMAWNESCNNGKHLQHYENRLLWLPCWTWALSVAQTLALPFWPGAWRRKKTGTWQWQLNLHDWEWKSKAEVSLSSPLFFWNNTGK